jgi:hypothetical protein
MVLRDGAAWAKAARSGKSRYEPKERHISDLGH